MLSNRFKTLKPNRASYLPTPSSPLPFDPPTSPNPSRSPEPESSRTQQQQQQHTTNITNTMRSDGPVEPGAPNLNLTPEEKHVYGQLFRQADSDNVGVVTGEVAVLFFEKTLLDSRILGEIWQIADKENRGFLTPAGFGVALRLIGHAQAGREPAPDLALQPGPLPVFEGVHITPPPPPPPPALTAQTTGAPGPIRIPPLTPEKVAQYAGLFERQSLQGNLLPGEVAKQIFEKSGLPNDVLGRIWMLADTEQRGALVLTEFVIAMHLLTSIKTGALRALPNILPAALYEAATRRAPLSGQAPLQQMRTGSPHGRPPVTAQTTGDWLVTPADKARFDQLFEELDKTKKGFITGEEAVPFFSQSNLSEEVLAQIWDLADIRSEGRLSRDEFAIAMYLIRQQRTKREPLPAALPAALMPRACGPSARPRPSRPPSTRPPRSVVTPTPSSPPRTSPAPAATAFKPFVPSSSFGRGLAAQSTGASTSSAPAKPVGTEDDLLGDADPEISKKLTNETTELANLSNQIGSLTKQVQDVQQQRAATQGELGQSSAQKKTFEQRLAQLRAMYEKEAQDVRALETQLAASKAETKKLQAEYAMVDASYQELQNQHRQIFAALQADQQENAALKDKIRVVNAEIAQLKPQIEKLKSEARQQKGLVAINKKQLATNEAERDRLKNEADDLTRSNEELARQLSSSPPPPPPPAQVASPALSASSSANNPFFRRTGSADVSASPAAFSAPIRSFTDKTFDDVFGPSLVFKHNTGASSGSAGSFATPASTSSPNASRQPTVVAADPAAPADAGRVAPSPFSPFGDAPVESPSSTLRQASPPLGRAEPGPQEATTAPALEPAPTGQSLASGSGSDVRAASPASAAESAKAAFGSIAKESAPAAAAAAAAAADPFSVDQDSKAKEDFEMAFRSFKLARDTNASPLSAAGSSGNNGAASAAAAGINDAAAKAFAKFDSEFPPITELERADESDSESDKGGFDDDFAPASPPQPAGSGKPSEASRAASPVAVAKPAPAVGSSSSSPPTATATAEAVSERTASPPVPTVSSASNLANLSSSHVNDIFGSSSNLRPATATSTSSRPATATPAPAPAAAPTTTTTTTSAKAPFDDLDDDFADLEDAREGSTADDEFGTISRSGFDDFNAVFDSSPPQSQPKPDTASAATTTTSGGGAPVFGTEASFDFASFSGGSAAGSTTGGGNVASGTEAGNGNAEKQQQQQPDWDALFAGLDSATPTPVAQGLGLGPGTGPSGVNNKEAASSGAGAGASAAAGGERDGDATEEGGAAVAGGSNEEDPVVKLTRMGYSRKDAVAALERYEYDLERAANFLASQS
ncbi:hypothetical protein VTJ83DRAFT_6894 [Remersonia thermophila]|uniref:Uncharacterized protein n=1 Tax=Remersonia thermophila TaxID=72144 RepID=A0ABR4D5Z9_9PEZI